MTLTDCRGLDQRAIAWQLIREDAIARDNALADGEDVRRDLIREFRPRRANSRLSS